MEYQQRQKQNAMTPQELQAALIAKQKQIASIVGKKEAARLMEKALELVAAGKKSILDII